MITIVDDDESVRQSLTRLLNSMGLEAETFASAEEFLDKGPGRAGCLILDIRLPGMSGIELQKELTATGDKTPVIFITAQDDKGLRAEAMAAGARGFLHKPFDDQALLDAIHAFHHELNELKGDQS